MTFQFSLWDKFKELSKLPSSTFNNLVLLVTHFLQRKCLSLSVLKVSGGLKLSLYCIHIFDVMNQLNYLIFEVISLVICCR